jgi:glycosyltransferase involved in cell wall biosynthesis
MGVDFEKFTPSGEVVRNANEILFVGRLVEKKGLSHLIRALDVVRRKLPNIRLAIIGFGPEEQALKQLAIELCLSEHIDFVGAKSQAELLHYYRRAALFVAPFIEARDGDQEGLGLVTIEAAACGCQVLVGKVAAVASLPIHTVDVTDSEKFSAGILSALQITGMDNGFHLRNELESVFSWPRVASGYAELLKKWAL